MRQRVDGWFEASAGAFPDAVAIHDGARDVSYAELLAAALRVRDLVVDRGAEPGGLVALRMRRGWRMYAAMLGIWKSGCGYVPIDPAYPRDRQDYMAEDSGARLLVEAAAGDGFAVSEFHRSGPRPGRPHGLPDDPAYVIYTSGSTGRPKGVALSHTAVTAFLAGFVERFSFGADETWAQFTSPCFDVSVAESWTPLLTGARLLVVPDEATVDPRRLAGVLAEGRATVLSHVPTVFRYLLNAAERDGRTFPDVTHVLLAGEPVDRESVARWMSLGLSPKAEFFNLYGPTEATVYATCRRLTPGTLLPGGPPGTPIGTAMPHLTVELLRDGRPVEPGEVGEIHLGGALATGYLGRPEQTARSFAPGADGTLRYATGDLATADEDGLNFLARDDGQIKLRGIRIELGEIEARLAACRGVAEAVALLVPSRRGEPLIAACFVPDTRSPAPTAATLRTELAEFLPPHMIPAKIVEVSQMPLTLSGKLDRKGLERLLADHRRGALVVPGEGVA
ncbi:amino acid adenylation domain-containing protein [Streptomyces sp. MSC1_001]|jgi:D-alanine--poly(phosphoribitol) ligase subunit 1|uniref:amino acid adenylation domain-containing protein n=1 Tax=Streptomyces sp. MSC1_001 TaxID=2909263 RepID=UPI002030F7F4|nr:amino acid adenylation domain-containing protein [Streptomyces sp. MSC1_001]